MHFSRAHSYILCRRRSLCSFPELQLPSTPASYIIAENRKEKKKEKEICSFPELQLLVSYIATEGNCQCVKKIFRFQVAFHYSLGLGKITQALVKLYPSKYSYKSRLYLTVERPGCHKLIENQKKKRKILVVWNVLNQVKHPL